MTHNCVTKWPIAVSQLSLGQIMACRMFGAKSLSRQWLAYFYWTSRNKLQLNLNSNADIYIEEIAFRDVVCGTVAICVKYTIMCWIATCKLRRGRPEPRQVWSVIKCVVNINTACIFQEVTKVSYNIPNGIVSIMLFVTWYPIWRVHPSINGGEKRGILYSPLRGTTLNFSDILTLKRLGHFFFKCNFISYCWDMWHLFGIILRVASQCLLFSYLWGATRWCVCRSTFDLA